MITKGSVNSNICLHIGRTGTNTTDQYCMYTYIACASYIFPKKDDLCYNKNNLTMIESQNFMNNGMPKLLRTSCSEKGKNKKTTIP